MWNVFRLSYIQRKPSLQIIHAFCQFVIIMLAWGDVWLKVLIHIIALDFLFVIATSVLGREMLLSDNTFTTSYLVSGGI